MEHTGMTAQDLLNVAGGILLAGIGWWLNNLWRMVRELQELVSAVHVKLVEHYVPRSELVNTFKQINEKLDEIQRIVNRRS
jgi:hypothetical protein